VSWFCKAGAPLVVVCALVLTPVTALARYPDDNGHHYGQLYVMGHHYGQLKHQQTPTPPPAPPTPLPASTPAPHHGSGGPPTTSTHVLHTGTGQSTGNESSIPDLPVTLPVPGAETPQVQLVGSTPPGGGGLDWLLLLILPTLAAVWVMVFARATERARRRTKAAA
jgi:hypothetical protein